MTRISTDKKDMNKRIWRHIPLPRRKLTSEAFGFTLLELLISVIIVGIVVSGLLYLVNEIIGLDRREAKLESVQRDVQRGMDYITDELREAVYVYPDPTTVTALLTPSDLPTGSSGRAAVPVLAFWKPVQLSARDYGRLPGDCTANSTTSTDCQTLKLRQSYYSLVVYFTLDNIQTDSNPNWEGQSRIIRYSLPQYTRTNLPTFTQTPGFVAPNNRFASWTPTGTTNGNWDVLVDYIDSSTSNLGSLLTTCNEFGDNYTRSPSTTSTFVSNSFQSCISIPGTSDSGSNQEVVVVLRGSAKTASQEFSSPTPSTSTTTYQSSLPAIKTRVLVRGAANKRPNGD